MKLQFATFVILSLMAPCVIMSCKVDLSGYFGPQSNRVSYSASYLIVMNTDGTGMHAVTPRIKVGISSAAWFSDSKHIAYGSGSIYKLNTQNLNESQILTDESCWSFILSPDDQSILLFDHYSLKGILYLTSTTMKNLADLHDGKSSSYSHDGNRFVLANRWRAVTIVDTWNTEDMIRLEAGVDQPAIGSPQFSPDGSRIYFCISYDETYGCDIYRINSDGTGLTKLTDLRSPDGARPISMDFLLSPTGTKVLFQGSFGKNMGMSTVYRWIMNPDGTQRVDVPENVVVDSRHISTSKMSLMSFSHDGARLAGITTDGGILIMGTSGEIQAVIPPVGGERFSDVSFSPDGSKLLATSTWEFFID